MILVIGGTSEGRVIAGQLAMSGYKVLVSTATGYGAILASGDGIDVVNGCLDREGLTNLIISRGIKVLVDSSHPFALEISANAAEASVLAGVQYIRYARPETLFSANHLVEQIDTFKAAADRACERGKTIFLTTGSKTALLFYNTARQMCRRLIIRVIPDPFTIKKILDMGVSPADVVAMHGPFSEGMNISLLKHYRAEVMVAKDSGFVGGLNEKISAATKVGIPLIIIKRPPEPCGAVRSTTEAVELAKRVLS